MFYFTSRSTVSFLNVPDSDSGFKASTNVFVDMAIEATDVTKVARVNKTTIVHNNLDLKLKINWPISNVVNLICNEGYQILMC